MGVFLELMKKLVELSNGCICCTLREDLLVEVQKIAERGDVDQIVIESTGISEPVPVAQTFSYIDDELGIDLTSICRLDTMVTVVDAHRFINDMRSEDLLTDRDQGVSEEDERSISDLLIDQIEFCDVLILNKTDLVDKKDLDQLENVLRKLQPTAKFIKTNFADVPIKEVVNTGLFNFERASNSAGWIKELTEGGHASHTPETEEYGISSFAYRRRLPFHADRFNKWMENMQGNIIRAKGIVWLAQYNHVACLFSQAGSFVNIHPITYWVDAMSEAQKNEILSERPEVKANWDPEYGDRETQFVIIGSDLDVDEITKSLDECLINADEIDQDWSQLKDPYSWVLQ